MYRFCIVAKYGDVDVMRGRAYLVDIFFSLLAFYFGRVDFGLESNRFVCIHSLFMNAANIRKKRLQLNNAVIATSFSIR